MVKTDVHFPTDISLLFDAIRKVIILTSRLSLEFGGPGWRQSKGKAGVPVELGLRVCIIEDQYQFILHHRVMEKETDDKIGLRWGRTCVRCC